MHMGITMRWPAVTVLIQLCVVVAHASLSAQQLQANQLVLDSMTVTDAQSLYTTAQEVAGNATLMSVPCSVISPSPACQRWCHEALADATLASRFDFNAGYHPLWTCVFDGAWGITIPSNHTNALQLQAILTGSGRFATPQSSTGGCRSGYVGTEGSCTLAPANHIVVAQDLSRDWTSSSVKVAVPCPPLSQSEPVAVTLCPDPTTASTAYGCSEQIPIYATHCVPCPLASNQGVFAFRKQGDKRCQPGLWGSQPTVREGSEFAVDEPCGPATYQLPGPPLGMVDPGTSSLGDFSDVPVSAMGLCLSCEDHYGSDGRQCQQRARGIERV